MHTGISNKVLRESNTSVLLSLINEKGLTTKSELSKLSSLSKSSISNLLESLINKKLIVSQSKRASNGGRKPKEYKINPNAHYAIGIDIGVQEVKGIIINLQGKILIKKSLDANYKKNTIINHVYKIINIIYNSFKEKEKILGAGISFAGLVDPKTSKIYYSPNIGGINESFKNLTKMLAMKIPLFIDKDANLAALCEYWFGSGKEKNTVLYIMADFGTGAGLVINGEIYRGYMGSACDPGHTTIDINGKSCVCGKFGCLETFTSYNAIIERFIEKYKKGGKTNIDEKDILSKNKMSVSKIIENALKGDPISLDIIKETGQLIGIAGSNLVNLFDPEIVILGGGLTSAKNLLFDPFKRLIVEREKIIQRKLIIESSKFGNDTCAIGAATIVLKNFFKGGEQAII